MLVYLFHMGLTAEEISNFLVHRFFLKRIEQQRASRLNNYTETSTFPHFAQGHYQNDKFSKYVDYVLEKSKYNWEEQVREDAWKEFLKSQNITRDPVKQQRIREFMEELEEMDRGRVKKEEEEEEKEERLEDVSRNIEKELRRREEGREVKEEEEKTIWMTEEDIRRFGLRKIPMRIKPCYLE
jgi:hypothetical protein